MKKGSIDTTIIGGGLTGLTIAYYLKKAGLNVRIIERGDRVGGVIDTITRDEFTFEKGPNTGIIGSTELVQLLDDLKDEIELEVPSAMVNNRWILKGGKWCPLPSGIISAISTPLFSLKDKFRLLGEPFRQPGKNPDETVAELVKRRMGHSFLDYAVDPFISGIYAGDPSQLVTRHALPKLYNLEQNYGSFIRGAIKKRKEPKTDLEARVSKEVFSVKGGLTQLVHAMQEAVGLDNIYLNISALEIDQQPAGYKTSFTQQGKKISFTSEHVISTINGDQLQSVFPFIAKELIDPIAALKYAKVTQVVACYKRWNGKSLNAFGGLVPSRENRNILGILFPSSLFEGRAPKKGAVLSIFMGGIKKPEIFEKSNEELTDLALSEIQNTLEQFDAPDCIQVFRYKKAIPQYDVHSEARFAAINQIEKNHEGLLLAGNIRDGIGIADRVKQARQIADSIINQHPKREVNHPQKVVLV